MASKATLADVEKARVAHHAGYRAVGLVIAISAPWALNSAWLGLNRIPPANDVAGYLSNAVAIGRVLDGGNLRELAALFVFPVFSPERPPFLPFLAGGLYALHPLVPLAGSLRVLTAVINSIVLLTAALYLYKFGKVLGLSFWPRVFALFMFMSLPGVFGPSRLFALDLPLSVTVLASVYYLYRLYQHDHAGATWMMLGLWATIGVLVKETYPLYLIGPLALTLMVRRRSQDRVWPSILLALLPPLMLAGPWYLVHLPVTIHNAVTNSVGRTGVLFGRSSPPWSIPWLLWYPINTVSYGFSALYTVFGMGLIAAAVLFRGEKRRIPWLYLATWFVVPLAVLSLVVEDVGVRFLLPAFAACVLAAAAGADALVRRHPAWAKRLLVSAVILGCVQMGADTFGVFGHYTYVALPTNPNLVLFQDRSTTAYNGTRLTLNLEPYRSGRWPVDAILATAVRDSPGTVPVLGVVTSYPLLNNIDLTALALDDNIPVQVVPLEESNYRQALGGLSLVLTKTGAQGPAFTVVYRTAIDRTVETSHAFHPIASWKLPDGSVAVLWQRTRGMGAVVRVGAYLYVIDRAHTLWRVAHAPHGGPWPTLHSTRGYSVIAPKEGASVPSVVRFPGSPTLFVLRGRLLVPVPTSVREPEALTVRLLRAKDLNVLELP